MKKLGLSLEDVKAKMMHYCTYQDRSHWEVEQKLKEFFLIDEAREDILLYLIRENYLNEERFTRSYIRGKFYQKHWGKNKIRQHLKFKQVPDKLIDRCWDEIQEEDYLATLKNLYQKYMSKLTVSAPYQKKSKAAKYLYSKGYSWEDIQNVEI